MHLRQRLLCIIVPSLPGVIDCESCIHQVVAGRSDNADIGEVLKPFLSLYLTLISKGISKTILGIIQGLNNFVSLEYSRLAD